MRIQFDIPDEQAKDLDDLMEETAISTKKDLFNYALTVFVWSVNQRKAGKTIAALDERDGHFKELVMPPLEHVARYRKRFKPQPEAEYSPI